MKNFAAAAAAISIALAASPVIAGVVITQRQTRNSGRHNFTVERTVMVQGSKKKVITAHNEVIMDLDQGRMYVVNAAGKSYLEIPYPPHGLFFGAAHGKTGLEFRKLGKSRKIAGYTCEEYTGSRRNRFNEITVTECVSKDAPGASEFARFEKLEVAKLKATGSAPSGDIPAGIPLSSVRITRRLPPDLTRLSADRRKQVKLEFSKLKPVTTTTLVSKVEEKKLPASTFEIPAGFTVQKFGIPNTMMHLPPHPLPPIRK